MRSRRRFFGLGAGAACSVLGVVYGLTDMNFDLGLNRSSAFMNLLQPFMTAQPVHQWIGTIITPRSFFCPPN